MNHLIKAPFSMHSGSRKVSIPINHFAVVHHYGVSEIEFSEEELQAYGSSSKTFARFEPE